MTSLQVIEHVPGPAWLSGVGFRDQPGVADHRATMKGWLAAGQLVMGGPFLDGEGGGMAIVRFDDVGAAAAAAQSDPAVQAGLLVATARPWLAGLSAVDFG
ncbi:MAG: uncharacterized protein QOE05_1697 [Actinomycetota bacterium]|jgi:uncharacterized protein YciI|nr:uncharacterized protein [Actinomycetota bacterium]